MVECLPTSGSKVGNFGTRAATAAKCATPYYVKGISETATGLVETLGPPALPGTTCGNYDFELKPFSNKFLEPLELQHLDKTGLNRQWGNARHLLAANYSRFIPQIRLRSRQLPSASPTDRAANRTAPPIRACPSKLRTDTALATRLPATGQSTSVIDVDRKLDDIYLHPNKTRYKKHYNSLVKNKTAIWSRQRLSTLWR